jgi:mono/diheme cytochrome c family protein
MRRWLLAPALLVGFVLVSIASRPAAAEADGKALFEKNCMKCHGASGQADTASGKKMKVPVWDAEDRNVDTVVKTVRENKKHKTLSKKLSDEELQAIGAYVATLGGA